MSMLKDFLKTIILSALTLLLVGIAYAWTEPSSNPPSGNTNPPITTGSSPQTKPGWLTLDNLETYGDTYLSTTAGNVGIGTAGPGEKLDVAGRIKSSSGGFVFPDNTVQTTKSPNLYQCVASGNGLVYSNLSSCNASNAACTQQTANCAQLPNGSEDIYGGWTILDSSSRPDTCNGDQWSVYSCDPNESKTCQDIGPARGSNWCCYGYRNITCSVSYSCPLGSYSCSGNPPTCATTATTTNCSSL